MSDNSELKKDFKQNNFGDNVIKTLELGLCEWIPSPSGRISDFTCSYSNVIIEDIIPLHTTLDSVLGTSFMKEKKFSLIQDLVLDRSTKVEIENVEINILSFDIVFFKNENKLYSVYYHNRVHKVKTNFLANISHEIRTPLNGILGMISLLEDSPLNSLQYDYINLMQEASYNLLEILNDVLDFSKLEANDFNIDITRTSIYSCIQDSINIVSIRAKSKNIKIIHYIDESVPKHVQTDSKRLKQVIVNLLSNSIKFSDKGTITLSVSIEKKINDFILLFKIKDEGIGIKQSDINKLFVSFRQLDSSSSKSHQGTGLGLVICKKIIELLNGSIYVYSEFGLGSTFFFTLPVKIQQVPELSIPDSILNEKTILVVDDNHTNRIMVVELLGKQNIKCIPCSSAQEGLIYVNNNNFFFDLIILDIYMPLYDGVYFLDKLKQLDKHIPIIAISSTYKNSDIVEKFDDFLLKPIHDDRLIRSIKKILNSKIPSPKGVRTLSDLNILIAEDILLNNKVLVGYLTRIGITNIHSVVNGLEVLDILHKKSFDILLLDIKMPEMDGVSCFKEIIKLLENGDLSTKPFIIATTAISTPNMYTDIGMDDYILKPINSDILLEKLHLFLKKTF
jgi:signal transduction histidine kinase/DNA-binding response OmpR family regulator